MTAKGSEPIIIIKKRPHGRHGHHGGAWKVAYADFVTAMMAFFLVMWIVSQGPEMKAGVAGYFRDPAAFAAGRGVLPGAESGNTGGGQPASPADALAALERAAEQLRDSLSRMPQFAGLSERIEIAITEEGLRIELREAPDDGFFPTGSAAAKPETVELLEVIGRELGTLANGIAVEGHTDSRPYSAGSQGYTNWELSADRANAARRILESSGVRAGQVGVVRGYADVQLRMPEDPLDPSNRRISIIVRR